MRNKGNNKYEAECIKITVELLQRPLFVIPVDGPYIHSYFNLSTTATPLDNANNY